MAQEGLGLAGGNPVNGQSLGLRPQSAPPREVDTGQAAAAATPQKEQAPAARKRSSAMLTSLDFEKSPIRSIGLILQEFGAGILGTEGPRAKAQKAALEDQALNLRQAAATIDAMKAFQGISADISPDQMEGAIQTFEKTVGLPGVGDLLRATQAKGVDIAELTGFLDQIPEAGPFISSMLRKGLMDTGGAIDFVTDMLAKRAETRTEIEGAVAEQAALAPGRVAEAAATAEAQERAKAKFRDPKEPKPGVEVVQGGSARAKELNLPDEGTFEVKATPDGKVTDITSLGKGGVNVSVQLSNEAEKRAFDLSDEADTLRTQAEQLIQFRDIAGQTDTNALVPVTKPLQEILAAGGINIGDAEQIPQRQLFEALQNQQALRFRNPESGFGLTGNTSDRDVKFLKATVAQLTNTPEANQAILTILSARQRREANIAQGKADFILENEGSLKGWDKRRAEIVAEPLFTDEEKGFLEGLSKQAEVAEKFEEAPRDPSDRKVGTTYLTPRGPAVWRGRSWELVQ